jgi:predicted PhzF superfamily epimerase YddE/YHI9
MRQETRQWVWSALFYGGFAAAIALTALRVADVLPMQWGSTVILALGVAITAAVRLSRMRLTEAMLSVYRAGVETARVQKEEREDMEARIMARHDDRDKADREKRNEFGDTYYHYETKEGRR